MKKNMLFRNLFIILVFIFLFLPIIILVLYSFNDSKMNIIFTKFTFRWYKELFQNSNLLNAFFNTILIAFLSTIISTIIGAYRNINVRRIVKFLANLPFFIYIPPKSSILPPSFL